MSPAQLPWGEPSGIWSWTDASLQLKFEKPVTEVTVQIEFSVAYSQNQGRQHVNISINGQNIFSDGVSDQRLRTASGRISIFPASNSLFIRARCRYTVIPKSVSGSIDARSLGIFISTIRYQVDQANISSIEVSGIA